MNFCEFLRLIYRIFCGIERISMVLTTVESRGM